MIRFFFRATVVAALLAAVGVGYIVVSAKGGLANVANSAWSYIIGKMSTPGGETKPPTGSATSPGAGNSAGPVEVSENPEVLEQATEAAESLRHKAQQYAAEAYLMTNATEAFKDQAEAAKDKKSKAEAKAAELAAARRDTQAFSAAAARAGRDAQQAAETLAEAERAKNQAFGVLHEEVDAARALTGGKPTPSAPATMPNKPSSVPHNTGQASAGWPVSWPPVVYFGVGAVGLGLVGWFFYASLRERPSVRIGLRSRGPIDAENSYTLQAKSEIVSIDSSGLPSWSASGPAGDALALGVGPSGTIVIVNAGDGWMLNAKPATAGASFYIGANLVHKDGARIELTDVTTVRPVTSRPAAAIA